MPVRSDRLVVTNFTGAALELLATVPAGERWIVKDVLAQCDDPDPGRLTVIAYSPDGDTGAGLWVSEVAAQLQSFHVTAFTVLREDDQIYAQADGNTTGTVYIYISGARLVLP